MNQCALLGLSRLSYYYEGVGWESTENLVLMRVIDAYFVVRTVQTMGEGSGTCQAV